MDKVERTGRTIIKVIECWKNIISQLHEYDWEAFKTDRRIRRKQNVTLDSLFYSIPCYDKKDILTVEELLDEIENEALLHYLSQTD